MAVTFLTNEDKTILDEQINKNAQDIDKLSEEMIKTVNGVEPDENGNVSISDGSSMNTGFSLLNHDSRVPQWDSVTKTLTIPQYSRIVCGNRVYTLGFNAGNVVLNLLTERGVIYYDTSNGLFSVYSHDVPSSDVTETSLLIATYASYGSIVNMAGAYSIDGNLLGVKVSGVRANHFATLASQSGITLRFTPATKKVAIYAHNIVGSQSDKKVLSPIITNLDLMEYGCIVYDYTTGTFKNNSAISAVQDNQILIATYTGYGAKAVSTACSYTVDGYPYGINTDKITAPVTITSPDYEQIILPDGLPMWSDMIAIGDKILAFAASNDEGHNAKDGRILVFDDNFVLRKTLYHDFGHCNTCHYNANIDALLIGNLPIMENDTTGIPPALYILYNISGWLELAEGTVLEFNALNPTIVNLRGLKTAYPTATSIAQIAACWGDNNAGENNIVWVSSQFNGWWFKIVLGKGENQYTYGTYTQTDPAKFNGTFDALEMYTCNKKYNVHEVTQGMDFYKGQPITAEGHNGARTLKWNFDTVCPYAYGAQTEQKPFDYVPAATYDVQLNYVYNPDGTILKVATEGIVIKDGYMYVGVFFYDNGNGAKPANSVFSNSLFKYKL